MKMRRNLIIAGAAVAVAAFAVANCGQDEAINKALAQYGVQVESEEAGFLKSSGLKAIPAGLKFVYSFEFTEGGKAAKTPLDKDFSVPLSFEVAGNKIEITISESARKKNLLFAKVMDIGEKGKPDNRLVYTNMIRIKQDADKQVLQTETGFMRKNVSESMGVTGAGWYGIFMTEEPLGFVAGTVTSDGKAIETNVLAKKSPFFSLTDKKGRYGIPASKKADAYLAVDRKTGNQGTATAALTNEPNPKAGEAPAGSVQAPGEEPPLEGASDPVLVVRPVDIKILTPSPASKEVAPPPVVEAEPPPPPPPPPPPCENAAAACPDPSRATCVEDGPNAVCNCTEGVYAEDDRGVCVPINPCDANPCADANRSVCVASETGDPANPMTHVCNCDSGFEDDGTGACAPIDLCKDFVCDQPNRGVCVSDGSAASCVCDPGFVDTGDCVLPCDANPEGCDAASEDCNNLSDATFFCSCKPGFIDSGDGTCVTPCSLNPCTAPNRTVCDDSAGDGTFTCACDEGFNENPETFACEPPPEEVPPAAIVPACDGLDGFCLNFEDCQVSDETGTTAQKMELLGWDIVGNVEVHRKARDAEGNLIPDPVTGTDLFTAPELQDQSCYAVVSSGTPAANPENTPEENKASSLSVRVKVPSAAQHLVIEYQYLSQCYPKWVATQYNDVFVVAATLLGAPMVLFSESVNDNAGKWETYCQAVGNIADTTDLGADSTDPGTGQPVCETGTTFYGKLMDDGGVGYRKWVSPDGLVPFLANSEVTFTFGVSDVGDGIYTSAAAIEDIYFTE